MTIQPKLYQVIGQHKNGGKRITIASLAKKAGVSYKTLWRWANGQTQSINYHILAVLCRELNVTPGDLLAYVPDPAIPTDGHDGREPETEAASA